MRIDVSAQYDERNVDTKALLDCGAQGIFIDKKFVQKNHIPTRTIETPIGTRNVDGTPNVSGPITHYTWIDLVIGGHVAQTRFLVQNLGNEDMILGLPWLKRFNPDINWETGIVTIDPKRFSKTFSSVIQRAMEIKQIKTSKQLTTETLETDVPLNTENRRPKPTIEEVPDEEPQNLRPTLGVNDPVLKDEKEIPAIPEPQTPSPSDLNDEHVETLPVEETISEDDLLIGYIQGESVIGIFEPVTAPLTDEHRELGYTIRRKGPSIGRITKSLHSAKYSFSQNIWIRAKTSISQGLAHSNPEKEEKPKTIDDLLPKHYKEYKSVFEKKASERMPERRVYDHAIDLKPDFVPRDCKVYPLTPEEQKKLDEFLDENLKKGYIRPSKSPMALPFFFVSKKESGQLRPCQDYRYLNEGTVKNTYPLPLVGDLMDKLKGAKIFTKLDLRWGYNNVRIKEGDEWKAAFKTNRGLFEPTVMFFGLCNSPATFQTMMNEIFKDMIDEGWLIIYMDDMLIFSTDLEEHRRRTLRVLQRLKENDLFLKLEKCTFEATEIEYLGMIVSHDHIAMDPTKVAGIKDWPTPTNVKGVRSFLGFGNFYRKFISHYSDLARPLNELTKKDRTWDWTTECQEAFDKLKAAFLTAPVLLMPDKTKPFVIESDASKFATGAVLRQRDINGEWHPCGYISHSFDATQRNYQIYDRELLEIIRALETWRQYLQGAPHSTVILSDHKNLTYFRTAQKLNRRQARWSLYLSQFDLKLVHVPGSQMVQSDALSRRPDLCPTEDHDNEDVIVLPDHLFVRMIDMELKDAFTQALMKDEVMMDTIEALKTKGVPPTKSALEDWKIEDGLLFFRDKCYVPADQELRRRIVERYHDSFAGGHPGQYKTLELIKRDYWWPGMYIFIKRYVEGCATCQQMKTNTHPTTPPITPIKSSTTRPFAQITMDFITDLPEKDGYNSIMVVVDHGLTKGVIFIPCTKEIDALGSADLLLQHVYRRFGLPDTIISDRGPQFAARVFRELGRLLGIKLAMSTAYHPQTDGQTERVNQELEVYLRIFCSNNPENWKDLLPLAEFTHNNRSHSARNASPFYLMMGFDPRSIPTAYQKTDVPAAEQRIIQLQRARDEALAAHELARQKMMHHTTRNFKPFQKGDKVWLEGKNLKIGYQSRKLAPKREGPFVISEVMGPLTYRLQLPNQWRIHPVFHASLLTPYHENDTHGPNFLLPPPDIIDGEEQYEVEAIVAHKKHGRGYKFLVKWQGYPSAENTWQSPADFERSQDMLQAYKRRHKL
ncbi:putative retrotransposable element tf2 155 kda protein type 1-like [Lyophyllum shimeji]|uniref:Retrotransposable element tf2 155 kDa protein type 1-like n=1 Tax=Lyophyllum shimeji TaxID=47721 RepID=A0A9P3PM60_LYOSH|nr:putative retrotransposable element tf2 155 kda protein type 1-like [Lyophyllum shimeji]